MNWFDDVQMIMFKKSEWNLPSGKPNYDDMYYALNAWGATKSKSFHGEYYYRFVLKKQDGTEPRRGRSASADYRFKQTTLNFDEMGVKFVKRILK